MRLSAEGVAVIRGGRRLLDAVDLSVEPGELLGLIGPNGAGKTTLLRVLAGLLPPDRGSVRLDGLPLPSLPRDRLGRSLAYLAQSAPVHWPLAVEPIVALGRLPHRRPFRGPGPEDRAAVERALAATGCGAWRARGFDTLSGGEKLRVLLARALAVGAEVLLVDEPTAALDPAYQLQVMELLRREAERGAAVVAILHDLAAALRFCTRLALLDAGRLVAVGAPEAVLDDANLARSYRIEVLRGRRDGEPWLLPWRGRAESEETP